MNYRPTAGTLKDSWVFVKDEEIHLFFLADRSGGRPRCVGHAVSTNWIDWTALPVIEMCGPKGAWDDGRCGTGHVFRYEDGRYYMAYTGRHKEVEHIGLLNKRRSVFGANLCAVLDTVYRSAFHPSQKRGPIPGPWSAYPMRALSARCGRCGRLGRR